MNRKRILDLAIAVPATAVLAVPVAFVAAAVWVVSRENPFFVQPRYGKNRELFELIKIKSMTSQRDADGALLPDELRLLPFGRLLRRTAVDEFPQLLNVIKGDMSMVGPRPLIIEYDAPQFMKRYLVRPGMAGLEQFARMEGALAVSKLCRINAEYATAPVSLRRDMGILLKTLKMILSGKNIAFGQSSMMEISK